MKRVFSLRQVDETFQTLSVSPHDPVLLNDIDVSGAARRLGSEVIKRPDEDFALISPPLSRDSIQVYGDAIVGLIEQREPMAEVIFIDETEPTVGTVADTSAEPDSDWPGGFDY